MVQTVSDAAPTPVRKLVISRYRSEPAPLTIPKSAFPHTADGTFSSWNGASPPAQFEYFDVPSAKGMYSFFYADFDGERLWLLNDWAHGGAAIEPDCYNQFKVTTGNGRRYFCNISYLAC